MNIRVRGISYFLNIHQEDITLPYVVMLHGFMGSGRNFDHLLEPMKQFCNPITIDLLGHGESEGAELHYRFSSKEQIADLTKLISEQLHIPLFLYGYSMGGRMALQLAVNQPNLFRGLILESSTFGIEGETERQHRQSLDAKRADQIQGNFEGFLQDWKNMPLFKNSTADPALLEQLHEIQQNQNPLWISNSLLGFGSGTMPSVLDQLPELRIPVQLVAGAKDFKFVQINQMMNKKIPVSALEVVEEAGHRVHLDQPQELIDLFESFFNQQTPS